MTPSAQISAVIELLLAIQKEKYIPADSTANRFFRRRRYIGGGDRRFVSGKVWEILRCYRKLEWWLKRIGSPINSRMVVAAYLVLSGNSISKVHSFYSGEKYAPLLLNSNEILYLQSLVNKPFVSDEMSKAVIYEVPDWVYPIINGQYGDQTEKELSTLLEPATLDLRVNFLKVEDRYKAREILVSENIQTELMNISPWGLRAQGRQSITSTNAFKNGLVEIQDEGSQLIALMTGVKSSMRVLDYCAGAGGKTLAMAMMMENKGHIIASDIFPARLNAAQSRLRRAGVFNCETHIFAEDAKWLKRRVESFDRVLVDAPCSGTGTWRRNPDARLRFKENDLLELVEKQAHILDSAARMVKKGGRLIYATCSILRQENQDQINNFLERNNNFSLVEPDTIPELLPEEFMKKTSFQLTPAQNQTDGFFCTVMVKN